jgi:hypothetical protein
MSEFGQFSVKKIAFEKYTPSDAIRLVSRIIVHAAWQFREPKS